MDIVDTLFERDLITSVKYEQMICLYFSAADDEDNRAFAEALVALLEQCGWMV